MNTELKKSTQYDLFTFRDDNREKIDLAHVRKLMTSISSQNMLELCPILVNEKMEIIDGQHRMLAAKNLGVEIFYKVQQDMNAQDMIRLNISKTWTMSDYLNFYCKHDYPEYIRLKEFMTANGLTLRLALNICIGRGNHLPRDDFREGKFIFEENAGEDQLSVVWETIDCIRKVNGFSPYTESSRFWKAMLKMLRNTTFNRDKWSVNMRKMVDQFCIKSTEKGYLATLSKIYNYRNEDKIKLMDDEE